MRIDDEFMRKWAQYDTGTKDEHVYRQLISKVPEEYQCTCTLSIGTVKDIYNWKAPRARGSVEWDDFARYQDKFKEVQDAPVEQKIAILDELPGFGIPVASTMLHFMYPRTFPIVDFRTVEVLQYCGELTFPRGRDYFRCTPKGYRKFRDAVMRICRRHPNFSLRQIDQALFTYHKCVVSKSQKRASSRRGVSCR